MYPVLKSYIVSWSPADSKYVFTFKITWLITEICQFSKMNFLNFGKEVITAVEKGWNQQVCMWITFLTMDIILFYWVNSHKNIVSF